MFLLYVNISDLVHTSSALARPILSRPVLSRLVSSRRALSRFAHPRLVAPAPVSSRPLSSGHAHPCLVSPTLSRLTHPCPILLPLSCLACLRLCPLLSRPHLPPPTPAVALTLLLTGESFFSLSQIF